MNEAKKLEPALAELRRPFPVESVEFRPDGNPKDGEGKDVNQGEVRCLCYISSRHVTSRLNFVMGWDWSDAYDETVGGMRCKLALHGVTRADAGVGDDPKAAHSDAFKRAAVKFGVGEYLYALPKFKAEVKKFGRSYYLTNGGWAKLRAAYAAWLEKAEGEWGKPLGHGDAEPALPEPAIEPDTQAPSAAPTGGTKAPAAAPKPKADAKPSNDGGNGRAPANGVHKELLTALAKLPEDERKAIFAREFSGAAPDRALIETLTEQAAQDLLIVVTGV